MADLYVNGLYWKSMGIRHEGREYINMEILTSPVIPFSSETNQLYHNSISAELLNFIRVDIHDEKGWRHVYNLDDPNIYVDLASNDLRTRKVEDYDELKLRQERLRAKVERPVDSRFDLLDL